MPERRTRNPQFYVSGKKPIGRGVDIYWYGIMLIDIFVICQGLGFIDILCSLYIVGQVYDGWMAWNQ